MAIQPLADRVLLKVLEAKETTKGGIVLPDSAKEKPQEGKIVAVGTGRIDDDGKMTPLQVKKGDTVLFGKYSGTELEVDGEEYLMVKEEDILGIVN
ncbi:MAG: co-chaperone GroES [Candidatus Omnitrophica bacterium]|nr:co-chaperone GroES [Candidatus Omnitrophota bacterium]